LCLLGGWGAVWLQGLIPLNCRQCQKNLRIFRVVSPSPNTPKEIANFAGVWEGVWKNRYGLPHPSRRGKLIVYEVFDNKVKFLWAIGDNPNSPRPGGWSNSESEIEDFEGKKGFSRFSSKQGISAYFNLENWKLIGKMRDLEIEMNRVR
jgi:hypothetical protein